MQVVPATFPAGCREVSARTTGPSSGGVVLSFASDYNFAIDYNVV